MNIKQSDQYMQAAMEVIPGGVNSPVRAYKSVGGTPRVIGRGEGASLVDIDGNRYLDYVLSWGALLHGHAHPEVIEAATAALKRGSSFGAPCKLELELVNCLIDRVPGLEMARLVNSGTEAGMSVLRLARAYTDRPAIVKFAGCYHGHADPLLVGAGSGAATFGAPSSPGLAGADKTIVIPYNDPEALAEAFASKGEEIAAVIVEPLPGNMGLIPPSPEFINALKTIPKKHGALLIIDEVMSGFRAGPQGAQGVYDIVGDLIMLGKVIGGGFPLAAYGGKKEIMQNMSPVGKVYQAGTLSGNPVACAAGLASIELISERTYDHIEKIGAPLIAGLKEKADAAGVPMEINRVGAMAGFYFSETPITNFAEAGKADHALFGKVFSGLLEHGVMFPPSGYEAFFLSTAHTLEDVERTISAFGETLQSL